MAGLKLKSGADLCGFELIRFCVQNDVAIPDAPASGRKYFHKGTGTVDGFEMANRERIYTGSTWRATAYLDDLANLDVANNTDFQTLKRKVEAFLEGGVDSDGVLNKLSEIQAFLDNYSSATDLTEILDTKLDKKGGTMTGSIVMPLNQFIRVGSEYESYAMLGHDNSGILVGTPNLPLLLRSNGAATINGNILIHSGNVGEQKVAETRRFSTIVVSSSANRDLNTALFGGGLMRNYSGSSSSYFTNVPADMGFGCVIEFSAYGEELATNDLSAQLAWDINHRGTDSTKRLWWRASDDTSFANAKWHQIAFTDSNVASAQALVNSNGVVGATVGASGGVNINGSLYWDDPSWYSIGSYSESSNVPPFGRYKFYSGHIFQTAKGEVMRINESGNVTIGGSDLAGTSAKLYVDGGAAFAGGRVRIPVNGDRITFNADSGNTMGILAMNLNNTYLEAPLTDAGDKTPILIGWRDGNYAMAISKNGNIGIGVTSPSAQLHVAQDIVANGTIACKGIAAEGDAMDMVDKTVLRIPSSTTQQTFTLNHGLGTREITISIYEITSMGTNMILTDVEIVDDNNISVSFGNPPTDNHMVVVMG